MVNRESMRKAAIETCAVNYNSTRLDMASTTYWAMPVEQERHRPTLQEVASPL